MLRLFYLQVVADEYKEFAKNNTLHNVTQYPSRGLIRDRKGELMVFNNAIYDLMVIPGKCAGIDTLEFCRLLSIDRAGFCIAMIKCENRKGLVCSVVRFLRNRLRPKHLLPSRKII